MSELPRMEEARQGEKNQPVAGGQTGQKNVVSNANGGQDDAGVQPSSSNTKKNWNGWKCPMTTTASTSKRKSNPDQGEPKRRKHKSKSAPPAEEESTGAEAPAPSPAPAQATPAPAPSPPDPSSSEEDDDSENSDVNVDVEGSDGDSSDSSSDDDDEWEDEVPVKAVPVYKDQSSRYARFDPGEGDSKTFELPNEEMVKYLTRMFSNFVSDKKLKESIMDDYPVPKKVPGLSVPKMDDYVAELFYSRKQDFGKYQDENWSKAQNRITDVMGPLTKLWVDLDAVRTGESGEILDLFECLNMVEKAITLVGQAFVTCSFFRRMGVLSKLTKDFKKAKLLLKQLDEFLGKEPDKLFGKPVYKKLVKLATIRKESKEISAQFGDSKPRGGKQHKNKGTGRGRGSQPFQEGPSPGGRGGGRTVQFSKRGRGANRGKFLLKVCLSKEVKNFKKSHKSGKEFRDKSRIKCDRHTSKNPDRQKGPAGPSLGSARTTFIFQSGRTDRRSATSSKVIRLTDNKLPQQDRGKTDSVPLKLAKTDTGSVHTADSSGVKDPVHGQSDPTVGTKTVSPLSKGFQSCGFGNPEHVGERGHRESGTHTRSVCESPILGPQEGRISTSGDQFETSELSCGVSAFQDGGPPSLERSD